MRRFCFAGLSILAAVVLNVACTTEPDASTPPPTPDTQPNGTCPVPTKGPTTHAAGDVDGSETWTADASPHILKGQVNVRGNAKLVIEPCAVIQLGESAGITVDTLEGTPGELLAEGTADKPTKMFLEGSVIAHSAGHGVVQGYDGSAFDWSATNTFEDVTGCNVTLPGNADTSCSGEPRACK